MRPRTTWTGLALVLLLVVSSGHAKSVTPVLGNGYVDAQGDAPAGLDLRSIYWAMDDGDVRVEFHAGLDQTAGLTAILFVGTEGNMEPDQAYVLHHGPGGDRITLGQGGDAPDLQVTVTNESVHFDFGLDAGGLCMVGVARTVSYQEGGQTVEDVVGWTDADIDTAWNAGHACSDRQPLDAMLDEDAEVTTPGPALPLLALTLAALAGTARSRRQG